MTDDEMKECSVAEAHRKAGEWARTGLLLVQKLQSEGWTPWDIEMLASDKFAGVRKTIYYDIDGPEPTGVLEW